MSDYGLLARRPNGAPAVLLQNQVADAARQAVHAAAKASGVKNSYYLDSWILQMVGIRGDLPILTLPRGNAVGQLEGLGTLLQEPAASGTASADEPAKLVRLNAQVSPGAAEAVHRAALASGIGKTLYLGVLIEKTMDEEGSMPLVDSPRRDRANQIRAIREFTEVSRSNAA